MKPNISFPVALLFIIFLNPISAGAQSALDAPLAPATPTVGSEVKRGADAADSCSALFRLPTNSGGFTNCVDAVQASNRQEMRVSYEAFDAGIYFMAKMNIGVAIDVLAKRGRDDGVMNATLKLYDVRYRQARDKLNLNDGDVQRGAFLGR